MGKSMVPAHATTVVQFIDVLSKSKFRGCAMSMAISGNFMCSGIKLPNGRLWDNCKSCFHYYEHLDVDANDDPV